MGSWSTARRYYQGSLCAGHSANRARPPGPGHPPPQVAASSSQGPALPPATASGSAPDHGDPAGPHPPRIRQTSDLRSSYDLRRSGGTRLLLARQRDGRTQNHSRPQWRYAPSHSDRGNPTSDRPRGRPGRRRPPQPTGPRHHGDRDARRGRGPPPGSLWLIGPSSRLSRSAMEPTESCTWARSSSRSTDEAPGPLADAVGTPDRGEVATVGAEHEGPDRIVQRHGAEALGGTCGGARRGSRRRRRAGAAPGRRGPRRLSRRPSAGCSDWCGGRAGHGARGRARRVSTPGSPPLRHHGSGVQRAGPLLLGSSDYCSLSALMGTTARSYRQTSLWNSRGLWIGVSCDLLVTS